MLLKSNRFSASCKGEAKTNTGAFARSTKRNVRQAPEKADAGRAQSIGAAQTVAAKESYDKACRTPMPYPTIDQFWRAYQTKERPTDLVARENQILTK